MPKPQSRKKRPSLLINPPLTTHHSPLIPHLPPTTLHHSHPLPAPPTHHRPPSHTMQAETRLSPSQLQQRSAPVSPSHSPTGVRPPVIGSRAPNANTWVVPADDPGATWHTSSTTHVKAPAWHTYMSLTASIGRPPLTASIGRLHPHCLNRMAHPLTALIGRLTAPAVLEHEGLFDLATPPMLQVTLDASPQ